MNEWFEIWEQEYYRDTGHRPSHGEVWQAAMKEKLPCGHPVACEVEHPDAEGRYEGTRKVECGWCADKAERDALRELKKVCELSNDLQHDIPRELDALSKKEKPIELQEQRSNPAPLTDSPPPKPEWKPGQMLINSKRGNIVRLTSPIPGTNNWDGDVCVWGGWFGKWAPAKLGIDMDFPWETYPRVGDWVRCAKEEFTFEWSEAAIGHYTISDLEPASPPAVQPKPTLEGPHWDKGVAHKTWHGLDEVDNCLLDLRSAVRELQSGINSINGKVGS